MGQLDNPKDLVQELEDCISSALGCSLAFLEKVRFDKDDGQQLTTVCLFARIVEMSASCKALLEKGHWLACQYY